MNAVADIKIISFVLDKLAQYSDKHKMRVNDAIASIQLAWGHTYDYLKNQRGEYNPNAQLFNLWNDAAHKTRLVDENLGSRLQAKARFWIHPDLPRQEKILLLTEIQDEVERLNMKF
jgi:hypothetical protein